MSEYKEKVKVIRSFMDAKGINKMKDLAEILKIQPSSLTRNLNYMISAKSYDTDFARKLVSILGITEDELKAAMTKEQQKELFSTKIIKKREDYLSATHNTYQKDILSIIKDLKKGNTFTLITTENPWEFKVHDVRKVLISAIKRGVIFNYIYPKVTTDLAYHFSLFLNDLDWMSLKTQHQNFITQLMLLAIDDKELNENEEYLESPLEFFNKRFRSFFTDNLLLVNPLFKYMLVDMSTNDEVIKHAFIESFVGNRKSNKRFSFWFPVPRNETTNLFHNLNLVIYGDKKKKEKKVLISGMSQLDVAQEEETNTENESHLKNEVQIIERTGFAGTRKSPFVKIVEKHKQSPHIKNALAQEEIKVEHKQENKR